MSTIYDRRPINGRADVARWFRDLYDAGINAHPDTRADGYETPLPLAYDALMDRCFEVADRDGFDVYEVGAEEIARALRMDSPPANDLSWIGR